MSIRKFAMAGVALALALFVSAGSANAAQVALSLNYTNSGNLLGASDAAGVGGFTNWNNIMDLRGGVGDWNTAGDFVLSDGTNDPTAKMDSWSGGSANSWGDPPVGGGTFATAGDGTLWAIGSRSYNPGTGQTLTLSGLSTTFANGFDVIVYADYSSGPVSTGALNVVGDGVDNYSAPWNIANTSAFNNNFGSDGHTTTISVTAGTDAVSILWQPQTGAAFAQSTVTGIQIVGEVGPVPEPSSIALAGLGLVGLVGFGLRRRRMKK